MPEKARTCAPDARPSGREPCSDHLSEAQTGALKALSEAVAMPVDQLARLLKARRCDTSELIARLEEANCVHSRQLLSCEAPWVWLTGKGARLMGAKDRKRQRPPAVSGLRHRRAVHEVRLGLEERFPAGRWICETHFYAQRGSGFQIPDGVFELGGKRQAIEVELNCKPTADLRRVVAEHSARYDAVSYYVGSRTRKPLSALVRDEGWPNVSVCDVPGLSHASPKRGRPADREPAKWERTILKLISEQGGVPIDQLCDFLQRDETETLGIVDEFERQRYAKRESLLADQSDWVWLKKIGHRFSGTSLGCAKPSIGALPRIRVLNALRLLLVGRFPQARWISKRMLRRELGRYAVVPDSVLERGGRRHAILVRFNNREFAALERRVESFHASFDSVICYSANEAVRRRMAALPGRMGSLDLTVEDFPSGV
jgi:DNA-binding MarR family transcriptional regulator